MRVCVDLYDSSQSNLYDISFHIFLQTPFDIPSQRVNYALPKRYGMHVQDVCILTADSYS